MRTWTEILLFAIVAVVSSGCGGTEQRKAATEMPTQTAPTANAGTSNGSTPATAANTNAGSATQPEVASANGQNYTFAAAGDLQIVGSETHYDILLPTDLLFDFDKDVLRPEAEPLLQKVKAHFQANKANQVHVIGHTDSKGEDRYNYLLSQRRAIAVSNWLKKNGGGYNMSLGKGETEPLAPNENPDGSDNPVNRQKNRRVTISVVAYPDVNKMMKEARGSAGK